MFGRTPGPYVIRPPGEADWHIERDRFVQELAIRWPNADIAVGPEGEPRSVTWSLRWFDDDGLEVLSPWLDGSLDAARKESRLSGDATLVAEYALWLRDFARDQPLILTTNNDGRSLRLSRETTVEEVAGFLLS